MRLLAADLRALRFPLLVLAAALLAGGAAVYSTGEALRGSRERLAMQQNTLADAQRRFRKSGAEREAVLRHLPAYRSLQQQGFIGAEPRVFWLDTLREANLRLKLFGVDYRIEAQQPGATPVPIDAGQYRLRQSVMKVSLDLLHEEDLMRFIAEVERSRAGLFALRECVVQRTPGKAAGTGFQPHLQAECALAWYTLEESTAPARTAEAKR